MAIKLGVDFRWKIILFARLFSYDDFITNLIQRNHIKTNYGDKQITFLTKQSQYLLFIAAVFETND